MLSHNDGAYFVSRSDLNNFLNGDIVPESAVARHNKRWVLRPLIFRDRVKDTLDKVVEVVWLLEDLDFLPEATCACFLILVSLDGGRLSLKGL